MRVMYKPPKSSVAATSIAPLQNLQYWYQSSWWRLLRCFWRLLKQNSPKEPTTQQPGDVPCTYADVDDLIKDVGFKF